MAESITKLTLDKFWVPEVISVKIKTTTRLLGRPGRVSRSFFHKEKFFRILYSWISVDLVWEENPPQRAFILQDFLTGKKQGKSI